MLTRYYACCTVTFKIERLISGPVWRIFFPMTILTAMSLSVFALSVTDANRIAILSTFFVSLVAFQFVVSSTIPDVPYLTFADKYVIFCFTYVFAIVVYVTQMMKFTLPMDDDVAYTTDNHVLWGFCCVLVVGVIVFTIYGIYCKRLGLVTKEMSYTDLSDGGFLANDSSQISVDKTSDHCKCIYPKEAIKE